MTLADIKSLVESETSIPTPKQYLFLNQRPMGDDTKTLQQLNVKHDDVLMLVVRDPTRISQQSGQQRQPTSNSAPPQGQQRSTNAETIRLQALSVPEIMRRIRESYPELADAVHDPARFHKLWDDNQKQLAEAQAKKHARLAYINANPFDVEAQKEIEEIIQGEHVQTNLEKALEEHPEVFGRVNMLYIDVVVNKQLVKAFVDSGAQTTVMSPGCAERCNIRHLIDRRYAGIAMGVGTARILGRVHSADIQIGSYSLPCSFTVMEGKDVDLLLGLDMLKRHQMCIDLRKEALLVGSEEVQFLGEADIPKFNFDSEPTVDGPDGIKVGTKSGALHTDSAGSSSSAAPGSIQNAATGAQGQKKPELPRGPNGMPKINIRPAQKPAPARQNTGPRPSQPQQAAATNAAPTATPPAQSITEITQRGFTRQQAIEALRRASGNVDLALSLLLYGE
ncbi:MAG: hypothetical protein Q9227_008689 [Pyrenula ochraceoflavens]